jgi:O-methyltransferase involved in polyketide biosynthesis
MNPAKMFLLGEVISHLRAFTKIPFAKEIARIAHTETLYQQFAAGRTDIPVLAARYEIRFRSVTTAIINYGNHEVLELACGLSPRGLSLAQRDMMYVEADLPGPTRMKRLIVAKLLHEIEQSRSRLHIEPADALVSKELFAVSELLDKPLTLVSEGLLSNLLFTQLCTVMTNVRDLLTQCGGVFITPDFFTTVQRSESLAREEETYTFRTDAEIERFIDAAGFRFERVLQRELVRQVTCELDFDPAELDRQLTNRFVYVLTVN